jgi:hypothetical protein
MDILFIAICLIMTGLLIWGLGWYYLVASSLATLCMWCIFKAAGTH